jgi:hypothetical protein
LRGKERRGQGRAGKREEGQGKSTGEELRSQGFAEFREKRKEELGNARGSMNGLKRG